jgi:hypothetical protein
MRTTLPMSRRPKRAGSGRAAVSTMAAAVLGVGASLCPPDVSSLIGYPPAGSGAQNLEALSPSVYSTPPRADITLLRAPNMAELLPDDASLMVQAEVSALARIYGSPELARSLDVMQSIQAALQSHQQVLAGGVGSRQGETASAGPLVESVVLVEHLLISVAGAAGPELVEMLSNVLPTVMRRMEILIGLPHTSAESVDTAQSVPLVSLPLPQIQSTTDETLTPRIADPQPHTPAPSSTSAEPAADTPVSPPLSLPQSTTPATGSASARSRAPDITGAVDPPPTVVNPWPSPTSAPSPLDEPMTKPQPEPRQENHLSPTTASTDLGQRRTDGQASSHLNNSESQSKSTSRSNNSSNGNSGHEQSSAPGNKASNG